VKLANSYADTHRYIQELTAKLGEIRDNVIAYSHQHNANVIQGSDIALIINRSQRTAFPSKGDPERDRLERFLKKLRKWGEVAELSTSNLLHILEDRSWDSRLLASIRKFTRTEKTETVRVVRSSNEHEQE
jgi:hypothetical protein